MRAVSSSLGLCQCADWIVEPDGTLEENEQDLQMLFGLGPENATLCMEVNFFRGFFETLGGEKRRTVIFTQNVRDLTENLEKV